MTATPHHGQEAMNLHKTLVLPRLIAAMSSWCESSSHTSMGLPISSWSAWSSLPHPRQIHAIPLCAQSCPSSSSALKSLPLPEGISSAPVMIF